jgi:hypothetical protein
MLRSFELVFLKKCYYGIRIKGAEIRGASIVHRRNEKCIQKFNSEVSRQKIISETSAEIEGYVSNGS